MKGSYKSGPTWMPILRAEAVPKNIQLMLEHVQQRLLRLRQEVHGTALYPQPQFAIYCTCRQRCAGATLALCGCLLNRSQGPGWTEALELLHQPKRFGGTEGQKISHQMHQLQSCMACVGACGMIPNAHLKMS